MTDQPQGLLSTTDAMVWASEFCRIFEGFVVGHEDVEYLDNHQRVDESLMLTWFANAIEIGRREGAQAHCPHTARFDITEDLEACRSCGKLFGGDDE